MASWSATRLITASPGPDLDVEIAPAGVLAGAEAGALRLRVTGPAVDLDLSWAALAVDAAGAAGLMARHCPLE